ncbi:hypothetical protein [Burkholderia sp. Bp8998]|uniref:hypothetical protein n=1 Tax=Burkholderia sp. Bp8998 TaxID=2184557 RepID=UPI0021AB4878|nr:hypothetical protein [Burkholderia sp. Bp8998]
MLAFNNSIDGVAKQAPEMLGKLLASLGGSITQMLQSAADGPVRHALAACGVVSGRPVAPVELTGSYKAYRASLIRQLLKSSGIKKIGENAIQREVPLALCRLQIRGEPTNTVVSSKFLVMIDDESIKGMPKGLSKTEQAKWLANSVRLAEEIERLNLSAWRERINVSQGTFLQDDKIDKWLKRCYWGVFEAKDRYPNPDAEMSDLAIAIGA